jgi:hypothetical protein
MDDPMDNGLGAQKAGWNATQIHSRTLAVIRQTLDADNAGSPSDQGPALLELQGIALAGRGQQRLEAIFKWCKRSENPGLQQVLLGGKFVCRGEPDHKLIVP